MMKGKPWKRDDYRNKNRILKIVRINQKNEKKAEKARPEFIPVVIRRRPMKEVKENV